MHLQEYLYLKQEFDLCQNFRKILPKGTHVFEYPVYVTRAGEYSGGIATIQCMYAPEFVSNTEGIKVVVIEIFGQYSQESIYTSTGAHSSPED